jgi:hypothetical protein
MITDVDSCRAAWRKGRRYVDDAHRRRSAGTSDLNGMLVWQAIIRYIRRLQVEKPDCAAVH